MPAASARFPLRDASTQPSQADLLAKLRLQPPGESLAVELGSVPSHAGDGGGVGLSGTYVWVIERWWQLPCRVSVTGVGRRWIALRSNGRGIAPFGTGVDPSDRDPARRITTCVPSSGKLLRLERGAILRAIARGSAAGAGAPGHGPAAGERRSRRRNDAAGTNPTASYRFDREGARRAPGLSGVSSSSVTGVSPRSCSSSWSEPEAGDVARPPRRAGSRCPGRS